MISSSVYLSQREEGITSKGAKMLSNRSPDHNHYSMYTQVHEGKVSVDALQSGAHIKSTKGEFIILLSSSSSLRVLWFRI